MLLEGLFLPVTTPFYLDGRLNLRKLEHNIDRYSRTPAAGFAVLSEHGDATMLSEEETRDALRAAIEFAAPEKVMLAGVSRDSVIGTVEFADYAASLGYDAVLAGPPTTLRQGGLRELLAYFQSVADRSPLPLMIARSRSMPADAVIELASHPNILGVVEDDAERIAAIKAATNSIEREVTVTHVFAAVTGRMLALRDTAAGQIFISADTLTDGATALAVAPPKPSLRTRTKKVGFQMMAGSAVGMLAGLRAGAVGGMTGFSACAPQGCYEVLAAWKDGDEALAEEKQTRVLAAAKRVETEMGSPGIRYACDLNGYFGGRPRLPLLPLTGAQRVEVEDLMRGIRN
jgi:dihydrodipicolinate synthase/N-acetylneuraminate lyase